MARDEIEEAFVLFKRNNPGLDSIASNNSASLGDISYAFRAGAAWALRRAVEVCRSWADAHLESARVKLAEDGLAGSAAEHQCAAAIGRMMAERIASLSPAPPRPETKRGENP